MFRSPSNIAQLATKSQRIDPQNRQTPLICLGAKGPELSGNSWMADNDFKAVENVF